MAARGDVDLALLLPETESPVTQMAPGRFDIEERAHETDAVPEGVTDWRNEPERQHQREHGAPGERIDSLLPDPRQPRRQRLKTVQRRHRQQIQKKRSHHDLQEKGQGDSKVLRAVRRNQLSFERQPQKEDQSQIHGRACQRNRRVPASRTQQRAIDVDGATRKSNATQQQKQQRDYQTVKWMEIPNGIQCEITLLGHRVVSPTVSDPGMTEFVQTQREHPQQSHNEEAVHALRTTLRIAVNDASREQANFFVRSGR